jgi:hypothetical protein
MLMLVLAIGGITSAACMGTMDSGSSRADAVLLFGIGIHVEPLDGERPGQGDYNNPVFFGHHVEDIRILAKMVERYGAKLTVQTQTPFTLMAILLCAHAGGQTRNQGDPSEQDFERSQRRSSSVEPF